MKCRKTADFNAGLKFSHHLSSNFNRDRIVVLLRKWGVSSQLQEPISDTSDNGGPPPGPCCFAKLPHQMQPIHVPCALQNGRKVSCIAILPERCHLQSKLRKRGY